MSEQKLDKLKDQLLEIPPGYFVDTAWLESRGVSRSSIHGYARQGWLDHVERGLYRRPLPASAADSATSWDVLLRSMQHLMGLNIYVGGASALRLKGHGHYLTLNSNEPVALYGAKKPHWLSKVETSATFQFHTLNLFRDPNVGMEAERKKAQEESTLWWERSLLCSPVERAILEAIDELPDNESFHTIDMIFEGLANLRPRKLMSFLTSCKKVKVKRLFMLFADRHNHAWLKHLDHDAFDLGSGDRSLVKHGKLHKRYRITVPAEYVELPKETNDGA